MSGLQINVQCECYHRYGLLYLARPWAWGRPCRRCRRAMNNNVIVVAPPAAQAVIGSTVVTRPTMMPMPMQQTVTTTQTVMPAQTAMAWQRGQQTTVVTPCY